MRSNNLAAPSTDNSHTRLVPELVLILVVISIGRFLTAGMGSKVQLGLLSMLLVSAAIRSRRPNAPVSQINYFPALGLLGAVALTYRGGPYTQVAVFIIIFLMFYLLSPVVSRRSAYESLVAGMVLYISANIVGWMVGVVSPQSSSRLIGYETSSPFFSERIVFPFSQSMNETPYIAAALLLAILAMVKIGRRLHWYHWIGLFTAPFVLLAANNRTTFLIVIVLTAGVFFAPKVTRAAAPFVAGAVLLLPFLLGIVRPISNFAAGLLEGSTFLSRGGTQNSIGAFEGRDRIWGGIINFWSELFSQGTMTDIPSMLFGYGYQGHVTSGAYLYIPKNFSEFLQERIYLHAHNSMLQESLDGGLIGAVTIWSIVVLLVYRFSRRMELFPMLLVSLTVAVAGVFESGLAPGMNYIVFYLLIYLVFFIPSPQTPRALRETENAVLIPRAGVPTTVGLVQLPAGHQPAVLACSAGHFGKRFEEVIPDSEPRTPTQKSG